MESWRLRILRKLSVLIACTSGFRGYSLGSCISRSAVGGDRLAAAFYRVKPYKGFGQSCCIHLIYGMLFLSESRTFCISYLRLVFVVFSIDKSCW